MTVPVPCPGVPVDGAASAPRRRRRRAPASGASDDCFACIKNNIRCDRRRPYCSQCLEFGSECSGYKTQLTWGVGVASRGKLRGLSLPIARSAPAVQSTSPKLTRASTATSLPKSMRDSNGDTPAVGKAKVNFEGQTPLPAMPYMTYDFVNMVPKTTMGTQVPSVAPDWAMDMPQEHMRVSNPGTPEHSHQQLLRHSLQCLHTPLLSGGDEMNLSSSAGSIHSYSDTEYSPVETSFPDDVSYFSSPMPVLNAYSSQNSPVGHSFPMMADPRGPTSCPDPYYEQCEIRSSLSPSHPTVYDRNDNRPGLGSPAFHERSNILYDDNMSGALSTSHDAEHLLRTSQAGRTSWHSAEEDYSSLPSASDHTLILPSPETFRIPLAPDLSPRLSFWLNYYDKIICPITVAIDSPSNPYRRQILGLSLESPGLQHAICALASCNLRMKRRQTHGRHEWSQPFDLEMRERVNGGLQLISNVRNTPAQEHQPEGPADEFSMQEEYQNRSQAVHLLNQQLSDPESARHDSALATLLILCHYRMCESGIARFNTQFAGVKKLLGMRASGMETGKWGWMETLFTFFDAITATVNDREAQLCGSYLDMIANPSSPSCALENLAGFDGKLFKIIATLGHLNLLSQHRPVLEPLHSGSSSFGRSFPNAKACLSGQALLDYYKFHDFGSDQFPTYPSTPSPTIDSSDDSRPDFWAEWATTRSLLQAWEFSPSSLAAALPIPCDQAVIRGFAYASEAFRYAALLYIERLACPHLPSGHLNLQSLVSQVLFFVEALGQGQNQLIDGGHEGSKMEKFLLWPLFVAGSECVSELHRNIVRTRCRGLVGRSGYGNNFAGLDVLEQIWRENGVDEVQRRGRMGVGKSPFRWTGFMNGVDGEYIMV